MVVLGGGAVSYERATPATHGACPPPPGGSGSGSEIRLHGNMQRFRSKLEFKARKLLYHSTLDLRITKKKKKVRVYDKNKEVEGYG